MRFWRTVNIRLETISLKFCPGEGFELIFFEDQIQGKGHWAMTKTWRKIAGKNLGVRINNERGRFTRRHGGTVWNRKTILKAWTVSVSLNILPQLQNLPAPFSYGVGIFDNFVFKNAFYFKLVFYTNWYTLGILYYATWPVRIVVLMLWWC